MPIKITNEVQYEKCSTEVIKIENTLISLRQKTERLENKLQRLRKERTNYYVEVLGEVVYSHSVELIDKFISDHNFNGSWPNKWRCERYFYYDEKSNSWGCYGNMPNVNVVYYREVELRYAELKLEGKI